MKRAFLRKVKPVFCSPRETAGQPEQVSTGVHRKARTSVAMFGLALSMGASSLVVPHHEDGAVAAESMGTETSTSVSQAASPPASSQELLVPAITVVDHVVRQGQTLLQIARSYRVSVQDIETANRLVAATPLSIGQTLKIPVSRFADTVAVGSVSEVSTPESVASAANQRAESTAVRPAAERDHALNRLREQRNRLKNRLAELRSDEPDRSANEKAQVASSAQPSAKLIGSLTSIAYRVQPGDTLAAIARAHGTSESSLLATNNLPDPDWIRVSQSLNIPASPAAVNPSVLPTQVAEAIPSPSTLPVSDVQPTASTIAQPPVQQQVAIAPQMPQVQEYRVSHGDTVAQIARAHNIPQSMLIDTNRLSNPNVIFVGQVLRVPNGQPAAPTDPVVPATEAKPQALATAPRAATPYVNSMQSAQPIVAEPTLKRDQVPEASEAASPRYVENLLAEVRALRAKHQGDVAVRPAAQQPAQQPIAAQQPTVVARREAPAMTTAPSLSVPAAQPISTEQSTLVATASIGSENYAPLRQSIAGRTVSPDLPPLQGAEAFLPEGTRSTGYIWPARGMLTSGYGWRWGRMHQGIDIAADVGTPIYAAATGVVQLSDWNSGGYGNLVEVLHPDGTFTRYAHLNRSLVREGQRVQQGEQIAEMGSTGYSTGPHLHFEVHPGGESAVNPVAFLPAQ